VGSSRSHEPVPAGEPDQEVEAAPPLAAGASEAELDALERLDPLARARAVARLQRSAGNAAVARRLAPARTLARKRAEPLGRRWTYDRSAFGGRFDGEVDLATGTIALILKVRYVLDEPSWFVSAIGGLDPDAHAALARFKRDFATVVHDAWSFKHALKPACPIDARLKYEALARVEEDESNPHAEITLMRPKALVASEVDKRDDSGGVTKSTLQADDTKTSVSSWKDPKTGVEIPFTHVVAAHEFGHMIGVHHINEDLKAGTDEYGGTYVQAMDVMGYGKTVSAKDLEPWIEIGKAYAAERAPGRTITWSVTDPDW
jgi:hypothetical protein